MSEKESILTEYFEEAMQQQTQQPEEGEILLLDVPNQKLPVMLPEHDHEVVEFMPEGDSEAIPEVTPDGDAYVVSFSEDDFMEEEGLHPEAELGDDFEEVSFEEEVEDLSGEIGQGIDELGAELPGIPEPEMPDGARYLPGSSEPIFDDADDEEEEEEVETNWASDRDTTKFMNYLRDGYSSIPQHNGNSISGCERALAYLNKLNREISEAVRKDENNALDQDLDEVEDFRVKILQGMVALKNRVGELKKKFKEEGSQKRRADDETMRMVKESLESRDNLTKEAKSGKFEVVITPFERAITGILVNSVVSAGHPFEEVYDYLKKKFSLTAREELAVLQIVMDMGFPIFKDRGTIGDSGDGNQEGHGVDFVKNYFG
jgi:hypothetical protein